MAGHTPGPWTIITRLPHSLGIFGGPRQSLLATAAAGTGVNPQELDANARLVAAAPELYEALTHAYDYLYGTLAPCEPGCDCVLHEMERVFAKVEGRS